jgi:thiosulfate/3-mercaptopyruvate sulfurtransferase
VIRLLDCRPPEAFLAGHVPGAVHLDPERELTGEIGDARHGRHPLPEPASLAEVFGGAGIAENVFALAYDGGTGWAARCWWLLRHLGHDAAGTFDLRTYAGPFEVGEGSPPTEASFEARLRTDDTISAEEILPRLDDPALVLLDARSPERWRGDLEPLDPVAGRIPGARNAFFEHPLPEQAAAAAEIVAYCGSAVTACVTIHQLVLAGREDARLYPGSFSEWCRREGYPIERGEP